MYGKGYYGFENNDYSSFGNNPHYGNLEQIQSNKKLQALRYIWETLGNLLSSAENFAGEPNVQYRKFNISTSNNYQELKSEFAWELHCFNLAVKQFQKKFQCPYIFPNDIQRDKIKKDISRYIKKVQNKKDIFLYELMQKLINGENIDINFDCLFEELDKNANSKIKPQNLKEIIAPLNEILDQNQKEADKGNMKLDLLEEKYDRNRATLRDFSKNNKSLKFKMGIEGHLKYYNNAFYFCPFKSNTSKNIKIEEPKFDKYRNLEHYLYSYNNYEGFIYVIKKKDNNLYHCVDFCEKGKDFNKNLFKEMAYFDKIDKENNKYTVGIIQFPNDNFYALLKESLEEEFKNN